MNNLCVFCGSSTGNNPVYREHARNFAMELVRHNLGLVYGGANIGLMKVLADTVLESGGQVIGVMPRDLVDKEIMHHKLTRSHIVKDLVERKQIMAGLSDAFVALPGGIGTMDELLEMLSWNQIKLMQKPVGILNVNGYFDHFINFLGRAVEDKFIREEHHHNLIIEEDPAKMIHEIQHFHFTEPEDWVSRLKEKGY